MYISGNSLSVGMAKFTVTEINTNPFNPQRPQLTMPRNGVQTMKLVKTLTLAVLVATAALPSFAEEITVSYGSEKCMVDNPPCMLSLNDSDVTSFLLAGQSVQELDAINELINFIDNPVVPKYTWVYSRGRI